MIKHLNMKSTTHVFNRDKFKTTPVNETADETGNPDLVM